MLSRFGSKVIQNGKGIMHPASPTRANNIARTITTYGSSAPGNDVNNGHPDKHVQTKPQTDFTKFNQDESMGSQGLQGKQVHDFAPAWSRESYQDYQEPVDSSYKDISRDIPKCHMTGVQSMQESHNGNDMAPREMVYEDSYQHSSNVSLYSVMQSQVPEPYNCAPTHLNMPCGGEAQQHKYVSSMLYDTHPSRQHNTSEQQNPNLLTSNDNISEVSRLFFKRSASSDNQSEASGFKSSGAASGGSSGQEPGDKNLSQKDKLKRAVKEYGATVVVFHVGISLMSLGGFYLAVSSGIDVVALLNKLGVGESVLSSRAVAGASTFVLAYAVHKVFAPVRIAITLTSTPFIVRYLRLKGILKAPTPRK